MIGMSRCIRITSIICLILAFDRISADQEIKCLSLDPNVTICGASQPCDTGHCIDLENNKMNCCTESHCPATGLISLPKRIGHINVLQWRDHYDDQTWYKRKQKIGGREEFLTCLIPKSFELDTVASKFDKKKPMTLISPCKTSSDCKESEFCGTVINPSFCPDSKVCLDKSAEDGSSLKFCFKMPEVKNSMFTVFRKDVGIIACQSNEDCSNEVPNGKLSCEETHSDIRMIVGQEIKTVRKVCAKNVKQPDKVVVEKQDCWKTAIWISGGVFLFVFLMTLVSSTVLYLVMKAKYNKRIAKIREENKKKIQANNVKLQQLDKTMQDNAAIIEQLSTEYYSLAPLEEKNVMEPAPEEGQSKM